MRAYTLTHLSDAALLRDLTALVARDRCTTAALLAHIAEVDARRLYVPAGYPSMYAYCVDELRLSEDAAAKRIQAARAARQFPVLFAALADGRLHLTAVRLLAPQLTSTNVDELIAAATHQSKSSIEMMLARRFPRPDMPDLMQPLPVAPDLSCVQHAPGHVQANPPDPQHAPGHVELPPPGLVEEPERFRLQLTIGKNTHDKLRYAQALLSHAVPSGGVAQVLDRALDALIEKCEKRKFAAAGKPRPRPRPHSAAAHRHVPAQVRRAVWERDQGRCTFVGTTGRRCGTQKLLEFDHVDPVARGGHATVERMRLRCRAHNQYEAERIFGAEFMNGKRKQSQRAAEGATNPAPGATIHEPEVPAPTNLEDQKRDVLAGLRGLGAGAHEARRAVEFTESLADVTLEERLRAALKFLRPPTTPRTEWRRAPEHRPLEALRADAESSPRGTGSSAVLQSSSP